MCKIRALRYQCGHTKLRYLSNCRGTYASPNTKAPLCSAGPSLTVANDADCQDCQYVKFCKGWEKRIADAEAKQIVARQLAVEFRDVPKASELDGASDGLIGADGWGDSALATKAEDQADREAEQLRKQFRQEQWQQWSKYLDAPWAGRKTGKNKKRRSSPKTSGESPLKQTVRLEDLPEQVADDEDLPALEPSLSNDSDCDLVSDPESDNGLTDAWSSTDYNWNDIELETTGWSTPMGNTEGAKADLAAGDADDMLPAY